jgi:hypothetical protein
VPPFDEELHVRQVLGVSPEGLIVFFGGQGQGLMELGGREPSAGVPVAGDVAFFVLGQRV